MVTDQIFDTLFDTNKKIVAMRTNFSLRNYKNKDGECLIYLTITSGTSRERISLDLFVNPNKWDAKRQRFKPVDNVAKDQNLVLDNIESKLTNIKTVYRLSGKQLTPKLLREELFEGMPRVSFIAFAKNCLADDKGSIRPGTQGRYEAVYEKLKKFRSEIYFHDIDHKFFSDYKKFYLAKGNVKATVNSNISVIKKWLRIATKYGIKLRIDIDDIKTGKTTGNRVSLNPEELKKLCGYYFSDWISDLHKITLGYFLFACFTGLRLSDVMNLTRRELNNEIQFVSVKSSKDQIISLNQKAKQIIQSYEPLFVDFIHPNTINIELKKIVKQLGIKKNISFHCGRHTFATNFLRMGGKPEKLQILLGHSEIKTTMVYVHILAAEANEEIFLLDKLF